MSTLDDISSRTKGAEISGFVKAEVKTDPGTSSERSENRPNNASNTWEQGAAYLGRMFDSFSQNIPFTALLTSVIGYIVMVSFGGITNIGDFLRYILFLLFAFGLYLFNLLFKYHYTSIKLPKDLTLRVSIGINIILLFIIVTIYKDAVVNTFKYFLDNLSVDSQVSEKQSSSSVR